MKDFTGACDLSALAVLVVDDNKYMRRLVRAMLRAFGIDKVLEADAADTALPLLLVNRVDIVIIDLHLGEVSGGDFVRTLRGEDSPCRMIPVIMMTSDATRETVSAARDTGVNEFLAKPISAKSLALRIWSVITRPRPFVRTAFYFGPCRRRHMNGTKPARERRRESQIATEEAA